MKSRRGDSVLNIEVRFRKYGRVAGATGSPLGYSRSAGSVFAALRRTTALSCEYRRLHSIQPAPAVAPRARNLLVNFRLEYEKLALVNILRPSPCGRGEGVRSSKKIYRESIFHTVLSISFVSKFVSGAAVSGAGGVFTMESGRVAALSFGCSITLLNSSTTIPRFTIRR
jgi:hypothetical protein